MRNLHFFQSFLILFYFELSTAAAFHLISVNTYDTSYHQEKCPRIYNRNLFAFIIKHTVQKKVQCAIPKINMLHNLSCCKTRFSCCAIDIYCTAALTSFSDSISYITYLFLEWRIVCFEPSPCACIDSASKVTGNKLI